MSGVVTWTEEFSDLMDDVVTALKEERDRWDSCDEDVSDLTQLIDRVESYWIKCVESSPQKVTQS